MTAVPEQRVVDPTLQALVDVATALDPPPPPPANPAVGQSHDDWVAEVGAVRASHIAFGAAQREKLGAAAAPPEAPDAGDVRDVLVPVDCGTIRARVYTPDGVAPYPALVMFHGGGFWIGGEDAGMADADGGCGLMSSQLGAVVVNVDYRQAPEHKFPGPLEDCYAALAWVVDHADDLSVDADRVVVSGASAGGNLAIGVSRLAHERGGPALRGQVLLVPTTDATLSLSRTSRAGDDFELKASDLPQIWGLYLAPDGDRVDPLVSPLLAADVSTQPPTHVVVAEFDPLREEGIAYAKRLQEAGVPTTLSEFHMTHSIVTPDVAVPYINDMLDAVRRFIA